MENRPENRQTWSQGDQRFNYNSFQAIDEGGPEQSAVGGDGGKWAAMHYTGELGQNSLLNIGGEEE